MTEETNENRNRSSHVCDEIRCTQSTSDEKCPNANEDDNDHGEDDIENGAFSLHCDIDAKIIGEVKGRFRLIEIFNMDR